MYESIKRHLINQIKQCGQYLLMQCSSSWAETLLCPIKDCQQMPKNWKSFKFGVCFSTLGESPRSEKVTNIFHWMLLLSMKCKIWRLEWSGLVVWLQTAFGDNPSEICARKTRGISVSHICAKIQPLLSSAWEECDHWTFFIPTNGLMMQRSLFPSCFSRFDFLPLRFFMEYIRKWYLKIENSWILHCAVH